ncbi:MAG TPA: MoaD/ThiS family protein [Candidatus Binataceae bacterium]
MRVLVPSPLRSYTRGAREIEGQGATLAALLENLDTAWPGMRFRIIDEQDRIRRHIRIFVNRDEVHDLAGVLGNDDEVQIICALTGG